MKNVLLSVVLIVGFASAGQARVVPCFDKDITGSQSNSESFHEDARGLSERLYNRGYNSCVMSVVKLPGADEIRIYEGGHKSEQYAAYENGSEEGLQALLSGCQKVTCSTKHEF